MFSIFDLTKRNDMKFEILDNRQGQWDTPSKDMRYFVRSLNTGRMLGVGSKAYAKEIIKDWENWDFGQDDTEYINYYES